MKLIAQLNKFKFYFGLIILNPGKIKAYNQLKKTDKFTLSELVDYQNMLLRKTIEYSYNNIPYYKKLFDKLHLVPSDIKTVQDLHKIPILTKKDIIKNRDDFHPINGVEKYIDVSTGGSTGEPLKYRISKLNSDMSFAILLRGWGFADYTIGDKLAVIAGGSLIGKKLSLKNRLKYYILNFRNYPSYGMDEDLLKKYVDDMIKWQPNYIRGYASSVFLLAQYVYNNNLQDNFHIKGIFTTSEMLFKNQRDFISNVFGVEVYDTYGLNDGGITAFECKMHNGMHIDMERGILEIVNKYGKSVYEQEGRILATTLTEFSMPLIRYDTGDIGVSSLDKCNCGCERPLLKQLKGRVTDTLKLNEKFIGGPIITVLMGKTNALQYQFVQLESNKLLIKILKGEAYTNEDENFIRESVISHVGEIIIMFEYVNSFHIDSGKKHKFIIKIEDI